MNQRKKNVCLLSDENELNKEIRKSMVVTVTHNRHEVSREKCRSCVGASEHYGVRRKKMFLLSYRECLTLLASRTYLVLHARLAF